MSLRTSWQAFCGILLATACSPATPEPSTIDEVYTNRRVGNVLQGHLMYVENAWVYKARCVPGTIIFDHSTCSDVVKRVPVQLFYDAIFKKYGGEAAHYEREIADLYVRIGQIDVKFLEFIEASPTPPQNPQILLQIEAKQQDLAVVKQDIQGLADQKARIEQTLATRNDDDLRAQLLIVTEDLNVKRRTAESLGNELTTMRHRYIAGNATLIDEQTYRDLQGERTGMVSRLVSVRARYTQELQKSIAAAKAFKRLEDKNFAYNYSENNSVPETEEVVKRYFESTIDEVAVAYSSFEFQRTTDPTVFYNLVAYEGRVTEFSCTVSAPSGMGCTAANVSPPWGGVIYLPRSTFYAHGTTPCGSRCGDADAQQFLGRPARGQWIVQVICSQIGTPAINGNCKMKMD